MKKIHHRVNELREKSHPEKIQAISLFVIGAGSLLFIIWLAILLPLQLRFKSRSLDQLIFAPFQNIITQKSKPTTPQETTAIQGQVGGIQSNQNTNYSEPLPGLFKTKENPLKQPLPTPSTPTP